MKRRDLIGASLMTLFSGKPFCAPTPEACVLYFSWFENVDPELITREAIESEARHSVEMDSDISMVDAITAASLSGPGAVTLAARWVSQALALDPVPIRVIQRYPVDFDTCYEVASSQRVKGERPRLESATIARLDEVAASRIVFLCYPNWDYSLPVAVCSALEKINWQGKIVAPLCLHGTGGLASSVRLLREIARGATILKPLSLYRMDIARSADPIRAWAQASLQSARALAGNRTGRQA